MHDLGTELGRFIGGIIDLQQLRTAFRDYLARHPEERESISRWLKDSVQEGRLSSSVWLSLKDLFETFVSAPPSRVLMPDSSRAIPAKTQLASGVDAGATVLDRPAQRASPPPRSDRASSPSSNANAGPLRPGMVVKERFVLVQLLGSGGMGQVFKARDLRREEAQDRNPFIALKVLKSEISAHPDSFMALQREARRAGTIAHPNVVTVYDFDRDGARIYMTMEYLEGRALDSYTRGEWSSGLPLEKAWPIVRDIAAALDYGHQKRIVHSDLKPGNIFICADGTVKVLDFGISRLVRPTDGKGEETIFDPGQRLGGLTPAYASLEMWDRESPDPRDDIYSLACVTYELLAGKHPFARASAKDALQRNLTVQRIDGLTRAQWDSIKRGLALRRQERVLTVGEFVKPFEPQTRLQRYAVPLGIAATLTAATALAVGAYYYRNAVQDSALADACALLPKPPLPSPNEPPLNAEQQRSIEDYLVLAQDGMTEVTPNASNEDLKYILSENGLNSSVNEVLDKILAIRPAHPEAYKLKNEVARAYARRAQEMLKQQRLEDARDLVSNGLKSVPSSQELCRLEQAVRRQSEAAAK
jgi:serine/threonine protein kinase